MAYIGRPLATDKTTRTKKIDSLAASFNSACTVFNLTTSGEAVYPATSKNLLISINGVIQEPDVAFTVNAATITFTSAPSTGATFFGVLNGEPNDLLLTPSVTTLTIGSNVSANTSAIFVGNSTVNVIQTSSTLTIGANVVANTSTVFLGNSTANLVLTSTSLTIANSTANLVLTPTDIYSVAWTDYTASSTITGWSSFTTNRKIIKYKKIGKLVFVQWHLEGTSNATSVSFTLPYTCVNNTGTGYPSAYGTWFGYDNGAYLSTIQSTYISAGSSLVEHRTSPGTAAGWTASGTKISSGTLFYESTT